MNANKMMRDQERFNDEDLDDEQNEAVCEKRNSPEDFFVPSFFSFASIFMQVLLFRDFIRITFEDVNTLRVTFLRVRDLIPEGIE